MPWWVTVADAEETFDLSHPVVYVPTGFCYEISKTLSNFPFPDVSFSVWPCGPCWSGYSTRTGRGRLRQQIF